MAVVLLTPALQELCKTVSLQELQQTWAQCLNCFAKYDRLGIRFARNCIVGLKMMFTEGHSKHSMIPVFIFGIWRTYQGEIRIGGASATRTANDTQRPDFSHSDRGRVENRTALASMISTDNSARDSCNEFVAAHKDDVAPWWMNEDFHWLNSFDELKDYGPTTDVNDEAWKFVGQDS